MMLASCAQKDIQVGKDLIYILYEKIIQEGCNFSLRHILQLFLLIHNSYMIINIVIFSSNIVIEDK